MRWLGIVVLGAFGCSGSEERGTCDPVTPGPWSADGTCIGMLMTATLELEADGCAFTLSEWDMAMDVPAGGTVDGSEVTLTGAGWTECTGTTTGDTISGTCEDGCSFDMIFEG